MQLMHVRRIASRPGRVSLTAICPTRAVAFSQPSMFRLVAATAAILLLPVGSALAQGSCAAGAVSKDGKPLHGAARTGFLKRCCEDRALGANRKPLPAAAKASYM